MSCEYEENCPGWLLRSPAENEETRLRTLQDYGIMDTGPEETLDEITYRAAQRFKTPIALVSLVDATRQWFKSCSGLECLETPREQAFCAHTIYEDRPLVVLDAQKDFRFKGNPLVTGEPYIRFYAGAPLVAYNGMIIGSLCVIDMKPRGGFSFAEEEALKTMAAEVMKHLEKHRVRESAPRTGTFL